MIVIATNNGYEVLPTLLQSLHEHGTGGHDVCVVDTGSTRPECINYFNGLPSVEYSFGYPITLTSAPNYDTGAFVTAWREIDWLSSDETLIFLQDSVRVISSNWVNEFESRLQKPLGAVPWVTWHPLFFCGLPVENAVRERFGDIEYPDFGIFANIFATTPITMFRLNQNGCFDDLPKNRLECEMWERAWSIWFKKYEIPVNPIMPNGYHVVVTGGETPALRKIFKVRK